MTLVPGFLANWLHKEVADALDAQFAALEARLAAIEAKALGVTEPPAPPPQ